MTVSNTILRINLSSARVSTEQLPQLEKDLFLGGRGLGAALLYKEIEAGIDPLGPENKLIFATGPLTGTNVSGSSKYALLTKSPLTGIYLMSISSRNFGVQLKKAGYDVLIIEGQAEKLVYLKIDNDQVEIKPAGDLWGLNTEETAERILAETGGQGFKVACIGPAGENKVVYASVINENRAAGRGGAGAVMGAKNLKAIAVKGTGRVKVYDDAAFSRFVKEAYAELKQSPRVEGFRKYGTVRSITPNNQLGILPVRNWQQSYWEGAARLSETEMVEKFLVKSSMCAPCMSHCSKINSVNSGPYAGVTAEGPEYETIYSFGSGCGIDDFAAVINADYLCDLYGLDTMTAGATIAFAMECFEKGILTEKDTGGIKLTFGSHQNIGELLRLTAYKEGFGELLALGSKRLSEHLGRGSQTFAMHVKGMELGGYDPRAVKGMALVYACGPRGGCHHAGGRTLPDELDTKRYDRFAESGKAALVKKNRDKRAVMDSAMVCTFSAPGFSKIADLLSAATGQNFSEENLLNLGERISNLERLFNAREGLTRADDTLPQRLLQQKAEGGPSETVKLDIMLDEFYEACGWDIGSGLPTKERLTELGLTYLIG